MMAAFSLLVTATVDNFSTVSKAASSDDAAIVLETAISGTEGANSGEGYENIFDNNAATKWCVTNFSDAYVIWEVEEAISATGYTIVTANDNSKYTGRNPASWILYGSNSSDEPDRNDSSWKKIDAVSGDSTLQDEDYTDYYFSISKKTAEYKYYKLEISQTQGASVMQLSEFALACEGSDYVYAVDTESADAASGGYSGSVYVHDGSEFEMSVGYSMTFYNPKQAGSTYYAYGWDVVEGDEDLVELDKDGPTCKVTAKGEGTVKILAFLDYSIGSLGNWTQYSYDIYFTINITDDGDATYYGSVADGVCPRCKGRKIIETSDGWTVCDWCLGSGKWTN